jgi:hypothetical protein
MASPKKYLILAKRETTQFTDAAPTPAANSILVRNLKATPLKIESESRELVRGYFGNSEMIPVSEEALIEFEVELAGAGAAGTAPGWGPLIEAAYFGDPEITAATSAVYKPVSDPNTFLTIYCYRDGNLYKFLGCVGGVTLEMSAKKIPVYKFSFVGKYDPVTAVNIPTGTDFTAFQRPVASLPAWTGALTIGGYAAKCSAFSMDMANEISHAIWMNNESLSITDRKPKGSITVEAVNVGTHDYFSDVHNSSQVALVIEHGKTAGNIVRIEAPKMQLVDVQETDFSGSLALQFNVTFSPNTGNDEVVITVK